MQETGTSWVPRVGEDVHVRATGGTGEVTEIFGAGDDQRFVVAIWPGPGDPSGAAHSVMHRVCTLHELAPVRRP